MENMIEKAKEIIKTKSGQYRTVYIHISLKQAIDFTALWEGYSFSEENGSLSIIGSIDNEPQNLFIDINKIRNISILENEKGYPVTVGFLFYDSKIFFEFV